MTADPTDTGSGVGWAGSLVPEGRKWRVKMFPFEIESHYDVNAEGFFAEFCPVIMVT